MAEVPSTLTRRVVLVPNTLVSQGMGHLNRCVRAARDSQSLALWFCLDPRLVGPGETFAPSKLSAVAQDCATVESPETLGHFDVVVLDFQKTPAPLRAFLKERARVLVGWDEGGQGRGSLAYLVDSLAHNTLPSPNVKLPGLLGYSKAAATDWAKSLRPVKRVVASFGGADPKGLTLRFWKFWHAQVLPRHPDWELTCVRGPMAGFTLPLRAHVVDSPASLGELLRGADLVVTSWGLTMLESLSVATPVLLLNPTDYHEDLARRHGVPSFGVGSPDARRFWANLPKAGEASRLAAEVLLGDPKSASAYWSDFVATPARCPVCSTAANSVLARTPQKSFHRCPTCSMEFLSVYQLPPKVYSDAYFFEDYQNQYGKTYLDDFAHIEKLGHERLAFLEGLLKSGLPKSVLDVGCAFGPFLSAARTRGLKPFGVDIAESAVRHVRDSLAIPAVQAGWLEFRWQQAFPGQPRPELVTMWYVIEHFADLKALLENVGETLAPGGIFAFGTPNGRGITRRFRGQKFWLESPDDHFSIWNRSSARSVLRRHGFEVLAFRNTGLHPERFPGLESDRGWRYRLVSWLGEHLGWGDTFEVYARKTGRTS